MNTYKNEHKYMRIYKHLQTKATQFEQHLK